ncbi:MAG: GNAT family N-acetyltransferase [Rhizobiales bacterium]|nr:GNAT family N-acetyltransferase [Hyphomicrobiales bacterium]
MVFLRSPFSPDLPPVLKGTKVTLRVPQVADFEAWAELRTASREFLSPWEPTWPHDDLTRTAFRLRIKRYWRDIEDDLAYPFFIHDIQSGQLLGGLTLSNVRRGVAQMASCGYWIGESFTRRGYMTDAVRTVIAYAFDHLRLHRLEAACLPSNEASIRLLRKCGFVEEGIARRYLKINGRWEDHLLFGLVSSEHSH